MQINNRFHMGFINASAASNIDEPKSAGPQNSILSKSCFWNVVLFLNFAAALFKADTVIQGIMIMKFLSFFFRKIENKIFEIFIDTF